MDGWALPGAPPPTPRRVTHLCAVHAVGPRGAQGLTTAALGRVTPHGVVSGAHADGRCAARGAVHGVVSTGHAPVGDAASGAHEPRAAHTATHRGAQASGAPERARWTREAGTPEAVLPWWTRHACELGGEVVDGGRREGKLARGSNHGCRTALWAIHADVATGSLNRRRGRQPTVVPGTPPHVQRARHQHAGGCNKLSWERHQSHSHKHTPPTPSTQTCTGHAQDAWEKCTGGWGWAGRTGVVAVRTATAAATATVAAPATVAAATVAAATAAATATA